ncbi:Conserved hypothetical protein CHP03086 [Pseudonocardia dioxanivorans CB1190]|uniref:Mycothiol-dependent maleylpyruvate isomerase metal-binding domain-containing protein n=1 Tax=Pseudonocardia dioxanivorans (strain ATCC 55486 / DSM 44775 / JCM 13855 / CB1190) TaxID=675635 RepID=F4CK02_PSEUX|nr:TIGR03086 family metal-binding protein [Pseudonocardia dioxanivorans]AEA28108.1 Conserved hypothetical protein CHP03086 [Pseudonocardia dioxanivorans CB1190]
MASGSRTTWTVIDRAHDALRVAVAAVGEDNWQLPTPCSEWTVTQVLQHAAGDQLGFAAAITGEPGPTENPFAPSGHIDGSPVELAESTMAAAARAWDRIDPAAETAPVPVPPHALPPAVGAGACALDAAVHAWDIAVAVGAPSPLDAEQAARLHETALLIVEPLRQYGAYAAALDPQPADDAVAALLRYLGRDPGWSR